MKEPLPDWKRWSSGSQVAGKETVGTVESDRSLLASFVPHLHGTTALPVAVLIIYLCTGLGCLCQCFEVIWAIFFLFSFFCRLIVPSFSFWPRTFPAVVVVLFIYFLIYRISVFSFLLPSISSRRDSLSDLDFKCRTTLTVSQHL